MADAAIQMAQRPCAAAKRELSFLYSDSFDPQVKRLMLARFSWLANTGGGLSDCVNRGTKPATHAEFANQQMNSLICEMIVAHQSEWIIRRGRHFKGCGSPLNNKNTRYTSWMAIDAFTSKFL